MRSAVVLLALLLSACAAPGSKIGRIALSGTVSESPSDSLSLEVTLPKHYGLGGLDLIMSSPEDFGHKDQTVQVEVVEGRFSFQFPPLAYHATFWLLPPLGAFPKQPPEPAYFVRFSDTPDEVYLVGFGWVPVDLAERERFGSWSARWMAYNSAQDVVLPGSTRGALAYVMHPQGETGQRRVDSLDADAFRYEISVRNIDFCPVLRARATTA